MRLMGLDGNDLAIAKNGLYWVSNEDRTSKLLLHEGFGICLYDQSFLGLMNGADLGLL